MNTINKEKIDELIKKLESFNANTQEDEVEEMTNLAGFIMDLGAGVSEKIKKLLGKNQEVHSDLLDYLITSVDAKKIKIIYSSAILRYTAYYKQVLPSWNNLLIEVEKECINQKENAEEILVGLKD